MDLSRARCAGCSAPMEIARVRCSECGVAMEGGFTLSPLARLSEDDQLFVHAFLRHHGSLKQMERIFGISYPTVKNRLRAITEELDREHGPVPSRSEVLEQLRRGDITVEEALERL